MLHGFATCVPLNMRVTNHNRNLRENRIAVIPPELGSLSSLEFLFALCHCCCCLARATDTPLARFLDQNQITVLPPEVFNLSLISLFVFRFSCATSQPRTPLVNGNGSRAHFSQTREQKSN